MELEDLLNEREWRKCKGGDDATLEELVASFSYFCSNYWTIKHPERGRIKFDLRDAQEETVSVWIDKRYSIVLKARQIGFSTLAAAFTFGKHSFGLTALRSCFHAQSGRLLSFFRKQSMGTRCFLTGCVSEVQTCYLITS